MAELSRFSVTVPEGILNKFDKYINDSGYPNRSKVIVDLIRDCLIKESWQDESEVAGTIVLVYDHHKRELDFKLTKIQHDYHKIIISTQHVHLDHDNCLEIIIVKGSANKIKELSGKIKAEKGIIHSSLMMTTTGQEN